VGGGEFSSFASSLVQCPLCHFRQGLIMLLLLLLAINLLVINNKTFSWAGRFVLEFPFKLEFKTCYV
jgi:hypothetical protein